MANKPLKSIKFPGLPDTYTIDSGLSEDAKRALLACFRHVAWIDEHGQNYYDTLESALYGGDTGIWNWEWSRNNEEQLHIIPGNIGAGTGTNGASINANATMSANRRAFVTYEGALPYSSYQTGEDLEYYPIPIPSTANKATVSISPAERYVQLEIVKLVNGQYTLYSSHGAAQGGMTATFTASEDLYACIGTKYSQPDAAYSENPTGYSIVFEEV